MTWGDIPFVFSLLPSQLSGSLALSWEVSPASRSGPPPSDEAPLLSSLPTSWEMRPRASLTAETAAFQPRSERERETGVARAWLLWPESMLFQVASVCFLIGLFSQPWRDTCPTGEKGMVPPGPACQYADWTLPLTKDVTFTSDSFLWASDFTSVKHLRQRTAAICTLLSNRCCEFARAAVTKYHRPATFHDGILLSYSSGE